MNKIITSIFLASILFTQTVWGQLALGDWRAHLSYNATIAAVPAGNKIYAASKASVYYYDKADGDIHGMSKVMGLSDFGVVALNANPFNQVVVVGYANANIDLINNGNIINLSDIKRKTILGDKIIRSIAFKDELAYVSCSFGIVVVNTVRNEIKETYYLGPGGTNLDVFGTTTDDTYIYAATKNGIYRASLSDPFIVNSDNWTRIFSSATAGNFNLITRIGSKIVFNHQLSGGDSLWYLFNGSFQSAPFGYANRYLGVSNNQLLAANFFSVLFFDTNMVLQSYIDNASIPAMLPNCAFNDGTNTWIGDEFQGLIRYKGGNNYDFVFPNGPGSSMSAIVSIMNNDLYVGHAVRNNNWQPTYSQAGFSHYDFNTWQTFNGYAPNNPSLKVGDVWDLVTTTVNPNNSKQAFFGSWGKGLLEYNQGNIYHYTNTNSLLEPNQFGAVRVGGVAYDNNGNLWMTNSEKDSVLKVKRANGTWKSFKSKGVDPTSIVMEILVDDYNQKWINHYRKGILVFNDNNTLDNLADDKWRFLTDVAGNGGLSSPSVFCMTKDKDGQIWCGTEKGICVFYAPGQVFNSTGFDAQRILIQQDGYNQYLLEKEFVQAIAVDGANRKWIGTQAGGVFLMSADGTKQILNFNEINSPLISNNINSIDINPITGEVFFGTALGICSYRGNAIEGEDACNNVMVYPNPVRPDYDGDIAIKGLVSNGQVKITDVSGHLVYETKALGGQAIWDGKNFDGKKVQSGVYLAFCSDDDGKNTCITKMLIIAGKQ
ncbi:MAG: hypothetical protein JNK61_09245 [Bacteroidia bacterium]|nr:hypothetical protein [Bacteroidia bacterium]